ncbi:EFR1 family ferrodoxin [Coprobacillaceae bacterium CR2/5/TPMF4]|nr:EFR1 family ferrodoxin [Coprobacillaceae bacterium CR2/5/TPMF4]
MKTGLYYFSATGNCLTTAKILAEELPNDCDIISFASLKNKDQINVDYQQIGFIFPIYYGDMPYLVRQVIEKMNFNNNPYVFLVATYRGHPGDIGKRLDDLLKTRKAALSLNVGVSMPGNSYLSTKEEMDEALHNQRKNIQGLISKIVNQEKKIFQN